MKLLSPSSRALIRGDNRVVNLRRLLLPALAVLLALNLGAFAGGIWVGRALDSTPEPLTRIAAEPVEESFALARLGELVGRIKSLEADARRLRHLLGEQQTLSREVSALDPELLPELLNDGQGGILLPPRGCSGEQVAPSLEGLRDGVAAARCLRTALDDMLERVASRNAALMAIPTRRPVGQAQLGSAFGNRVDPFRKRLAFHSGVDFALPSGSAVLAAAGGRVRSARYHGGYGRVVEIDHGNGLVTRYAHLSRFHVEAGDLVTPGQRIAAVGSSGRSTGPHLHFEVLHHGRFVDPQRFLALADLERSDHALAHD